MARALSLLVSAPHFISSSADITLGGNGDLHGFLHTSKTLTNCHNAVYGLDSIGSLKWRFEPTDWCLESHHDGANGNIYVQAHGNDMASMYDPIMFALDGSDGSIKWQMPLKSGPPDPRLTVFQDNVCVCHGSNLDVLDETGSLKWRSTEGCDVRFGPYGSLVQFWQHTMTMRSSETGTAKWSVEGLEVDTWQLTEDGIIVSQVSGIDSPNDHVSLSYLRGADGSVAWNISLPVSQDWDIDRHFVKNGLNPVLGSNGEVYVNGLDKDGVCTLQAFDVVNGSMLRSMPCIPASPPQHMALLNDDGTQEDVFVYSVVSKYMDGLGWKTSATNVLAYNGIGNLLWNASFPEEDYPYLHLGQDGTVFALENSYSSTKAVIAIRNGLEVWREATSGATLTNNGITYLEHGNSIIAVDVNGLQVWSYDPSAQIALV